MAIIRINMKHLIYERSVTKLKDRDKASFVLVFKYAYDLVLCNHLECSEIMHLHKAKRKIIG